MEKAPQFLRYITDDRSRSDSISPFPPSPTSTLTPHILAFQSVPFVLISQLPTFAVLNFSYPQRRIHNSFSEHIILTNKSAKMKFSAAAVLAAAAGAHAWSNVTYTTEIVTAVTTYCPGPTEITHGGNTYTVTEATTLTISDCPCTVTKPIITTSSVICHSCTGYVNSTIPAPTSAGSVGTGSAPAVVTPTVSPSEVPTAGAGKAAALSGAGLVGVLGLAAILL
ncbi:hypothetical protein GE21DRAFT_7854 [Neurospora crassa]|nr:clock-controlled gene-6 [Neurospora crassa OR74A]EAA31450.2 clock-controlled gene-6 [Neurospora crassa OR74A]KHE86891.1 hypothetical protein GE21DRAFT_7854 [Neurospora crassa]|eukprot:XP_960686.2 clock-controlled gene-6 [Neurospora crassa OR74A]